MSAYTMKHTESIDINAELRRKQGRLTLRRFAALIPCSAAYLSDIYRGRRDPGPKILDYLGLELVNEPPIRRIYRRKDEK